MLICSISGEPTSHPVLSPKSQSIFDRSLLQAYIEKHGKDPISNEPLAIEDVIPVRLSSDVSGMKNLALIPSLLQIFQNEWDAVVLENFELKKKVKNLQDDLASSVYHYDASIRVIAKLSKERDEAVRKLQEILLGKHATTNEKMEVDEPPIELEVPAERKAEINAEVESSMDHAKTEAEPDTDPLARIREADAFLSAIHQKQLKENKSSLNTSKHTIFLENVSPFTGFDKLTVPVSNQLLGQTASGIFHNELLLVSNKLSVFVLNLLVNLLINKFKISTLHNPQEPLTCSTFVNAGSVAEPSFKPVLGFEDGTSLIIDTDLSLKAPPAKSETPTTIAIAHKASEAAVISLITHPSLNNCLVQVYRNGVWNLVDCQKGTELFKLTLEAGASLEYTCADLHMDGSLLAIGTSSGMVMIYDLKSGSKLTTFQESETPEDDSVVSNVFYANNGYWLILLKTLLKEKKSQLNIWDLRKGLIVTTIKFNKTVSKISLDKFSQVMVVLFTDSTIEFFKYLKKGKEWKGIANLAETFQQYVKPSESKYGLVNIYWQKSFDRAFYALKSDGQWGKFAVDFN